MSKRQTYRVRAIYATLFPPIGHSSWLVEAETPAKAAGLAYLANCYHTYEARLEVSVATCEGAWQPIETYDCVGGKNHD